MAIQKAKELLEVAESLADPEPEEPESDLVIAQNMQQAEQVGQIDDQIRKGEIPIPQ